VVAEQNLMEPKNGGGDSFRDDPVLTNFELQEIPSTMLGSGIFAGNPNCDCHFAPPFRATAIRMLPARLQ
jgi:hypothetical protein